MSAHAAPQAFAPFFSAAIARGFLKKVPIMKDPTNPRKIIVVACGHMTHNCNRFQHIWNRVTELTQLICLNGGGIVIDPQYARSGREHDLYHRAAIGQILDFVDMAVADGTIEEGEELSAYLYFEVPCKVVSQLAMIPATFVQSSIRAKTHLKGFHPHRVTFKVGILYFLGEPITQDGLTYYAPRCDLQRFIEEYEPESVRARLTPA